MTPNPFLDSAGKPAADDPEIFRESQWGPYAGMGYNPFSKAGIPVMVPTAAILLRYGLPYDPWSED